MTVIYITYGNIFTSTAFFVYKVGSVMLCVIVLFNIIKGVLLMTMINRFLMHLRDTFCLTMAFRKLVHPLVL